MCLDDGRSITWITDFHHGLLGHELYSDNGTCKGRGTAYFHGFRLLKALLSHLSTWTEGSALTPTSQIAIAANSNGCHGLYMYIDRLAAFIRDDGSNGEIGLGLTQADVRALASSEVRACLEAENLVNDPSQNIFTWNAYVRTDFDDHISAPDSTSDPSVANGLWYSSLVYYDGKEFEFNRDWGTILFSTESPTSIADASGVNTLDDSCVAAHGPDGNCGSCGLAACLDTMHVLLNHVTTPVFVGAQLYDPGVRRSRNQSYTRMTDSFSPLGYVADPGSVCGSHDENFACTEQSDCPEFAIACDPAWTKTPIYHPIDFAERVRLIAQGFTNRASGTPEETPDGTGPPVGHAVFAPEWDMHVGWFDVEKLTHRICDDLAPGSCAWESAPLAVALKAWLEHNATVICVEQDEPGVDPDRPLTSWSETTPGPLLDARCGLSTAAKNDGTATQP